MTLLLQFVPFMVAIALGSNWGVSPLHLGVVSALVMITAWLRGYLYGFETGVKEFVRALIEERKRGQE